MNSFPDGRETIGQRLTSLAAESPGSPALTVGARTVSRRALDRRTNQLARALLEGGVSANSLVTIALPNSIEFLETAVACWKIGAIPQPVSSRLPARELRAIVELAESSIVVGVAPDAVSGRRTLQVEEMDASTFEDVPLPPAISHTWKAPTSGGSTGRPKLVLSGDPSTVTSVPPRGILPGGCVLIPGPLYHNAPFTFASHGLFWGNHVVLLPRFDAEDTLRAIDRHRPDFMLVVPTMMIRMLRLDEYVRARYDISSLRTVWHMGAPCPEWAKRAWMEWFGPEKTWELYTGTEAQAVTTIRGDEWLEHPGSVGRVTSGEMRVVDPDTGHEAPPGVIGEIYLRPLPGSAPTYHYIGAEPRSIDEGWETLGDMGWFDKEGYLFLADRRSDMILSGGANVYPAEVESALNEHPAVDSCAVVGLPHAELGQAVHAILRAVHSVPVPDDDELASFLESRLVRYKVPRSFEWVDEPLRDEAGKVRRSMLLSERVAP